MPQENPVTYLVNHKLEWIKTIRSATQCGLITAKNVEEFVVKNLSDYDLDTFDFEDFFKILRVSFTIARKVEEKTWEILYTANQILEIKATSLLDLHDAGFEITGFDPEELKIWKRKEYSFGEILSKFG